MRGRGGRDDGVVHPLPLLTSITLRLATRMSSNFNAKEHGWIKVVMKPGATESAGRTTGAVAET